MQLSSFFGHDEKLGAFVTSVMHVDARDLTFAERPDGTRTAAIEVLATTFGENGQVADQADRRYTFTATATAYERALSGGLVYRMQVPLKQPGPYQLRIALRDVASDRIGSASRFIDVPDVKKGQLTLSGLVIEGVAQRRLAPTMTRATRHRRWQCERSGRAPTPAMCAACTTLVVARMACRSSTSRRVSIGKGSRCSAAPSAARFLYRPARRRSSAASCISRLTCRPATTCSSSTSPTVSRRRSTRTTQTIDFSVTR